MKISTNKLEIMLARQCKTISDLRKAASPKTITRIKQGCSVTPRTAGAIAKALDIDVTEILEEA